MTGVEAGIVSTNRGLDGADSLLQTRCVIDIYDVLGHIAYSRNMMTRAHRAEVGKRRIDVVL
jgi:hypothetical protein